MRIDHDREVVSAIALVFNSPASFLFLYHHHNLIFDLHAGAPSPSR